GSLWRSRLPRHNPPRLRPGPGKAQVEPADDGGRHCDRAAGAQAEEAPTAHVIARLVTSRGGLSVLVFVRRDGSVGLTATSDGEACPPARRFDHVNPSKSP